MSARPQERLLDEWDARPGLDERDMKDLESLSITWRAQYRAGGVWFANVATCGRTFLFHPDGERMLVLGIWSGPAPSWWHPVGDLWLNDLIAFRPDDPGRWWYRTGNGGVLGEDNLLLALETGYPITLQPDPLAWLQADCRGAVHLDDLDMRYGASWGAAA